MEIIGKDCMDIIWRYVYELYLVDVLQELKHKVRDRQKDHRKYERHQRTLQFQRREAERLYREQRYEREIRESNKIHYGNEFRSMEETIGYKRGRHSLFQIRIR